TAMLLSPRTDVYRKRPDGCTASSAPLTSLPGDCFGGSAETVCSSVSPPFDLSIENAVTVTFSSLITYPNRPLGCTEKWRGPAPGATLTLGGWFSCSKPLRPSNW